MKRVKFFGFIFLIFFLTACQERDVNSEEFRPVGTNYNLYEIIFRDPITINPVEVKDYIYEKIQSSCKVLTSTGNPSERLNILIIGKDYPPRIGKVIQEGKNDLSDQRLVSFGHDLIFLKKSLAIMQTNPGYIETETDFFSQTKDLMNFYALETESEILWGGQTCCDPKVLLEEILHKCPYPIDYVIVLRYLGMNNNSVPHIHAHPWIGVHVQYSSGILIVEESNEIIRGEDGPTIELHEFGHAFGNMIHTEIDRDDYLLFEKSSYDPEPIIDLYPGVDKEGCPKWCSGQLDTSQFCYQYYEGFKMCESENNQKNINISLECLRKWNNKAEAEIGIKLPYCDLGKDCIQGTGCFFMKQGINTWRETLYDVMSYSTTASLHWRVPTNSALKEEELYTKYGGYTKTYMKEKIAKIIALHNLENEGYIIKQLKEEIKRMEGTKLDPLICRYCKIPTQCSGFCQDECDQRGFKGQALWVSHGEESLECGCSCYN